MRILIVLTYYRPHTSGLTIYAERLAQALAKRGHTVTVLTSQFDKKLPLEEYQEGVRIIRVPVLMHISKGVIMPAFGRMASKLVKENDVIQLHLPQFDAAGVALRGRLFKKPTVITYHCDLIMPPGILSRAANLSVHLMNNLAALFTHKIITYTKDYAENSPFLKNHLNKLEVIPPPVVLPAVTQTEIEAYRRETNPDNRYPVIGLAARFATEKGVEVLLDALPEIIEKFPKAQVQFAGPYEGIIGEEKYFDRLIPTIREFQKGNHWVFLGTLNPKQMARFYPNIDVLVLPSLNSTEAFGLVQIEAMFNGKPCIASNLPGVRQPVKIHGMGKIVAIGNSGELKDSVIEILTNIEKFNKIDSRLQTEYLPDNIAIRYEELFEKIKSDL